MGRDLEFFFDYGSPWSYMANTRLPALAGRAGATIVYKPMLLGGVFKATGNSSPATRNVQAKLRYGSIDMMRWVGRYGVPFKPNPYFPINTLRLMRGAVASQMKGFFPGYHRALFSAMWEQEKNLGEEAVFRDILEQTGINTAQLFELIETAEVKDRLRANTEEAVRRGVFGAPSFFVGDELFWGNDRLDFVEDALTRD